MNLATLIFVGACFALTIGVLFAIELAFPVRQTRDDMAEPHGDVPHIINKGD